MITSVTYHGDPARSADETGRAPGGTWHRAYMVNLPTSPKPPGFPGPQPSWWVWGWGGQLWAPAAVRGAPLYLGGWQFTTGPHAGETHDVIIVAASNNMVREAFDGSVTACPVSLNVSQASTVPNTARPRLARSSRPSTF